MPIKPCLVSITISYTSKLRLRKVKEIHQSHSQ